MEEKCPPSGENSDSTVNSNCQFPDEHSVSVVAASKYKGVIGQSNGHCQRVWLGTFKTETEAAMAYDRAAIKLRGSSHSYRNNTSAKEPSFQDQFTTETVLNMIKDGSYTIRFAEFLTGRDQPVPDPTTLSRAPIPAGAVVRQLFHKENRLVIPKKHALKYFPMIYGGDERKGNNVDDLELVFFDREMRSWRFRYCYWRSSQSLVFTRGWSAFVKEKGLREMDHVIFSSCEWADQSLRMIDAVHRRDGATEEPKGFKLFGVHIF